MSRTRSHRRRRVSADPLHVVAGPDGTVVMFLPDGRSVALTVEAAACSTLLLARAVRRANLQAGDTAAPSPGQSGMVIPVDFRTVARQS